MFAGKVFAVAHTGLSRHVTNSVALQLARHIESLGGEVRRPPSGRRVGFERGSDGKRLLEEAARPIIVAGKDDQIEHVAQCFGVPAERLLREADVVNCGYVQEAVRDGGRCGEITSYAIRRAEDDGSRANKRAERPAQKGEVSIDGVPAAKRPRIASGFSRWSFPAKCLTDFPSFPSAPQNNPREWSEILPDSGLGSRVLMYATDGVEPRGRIAAFDVDGTIVTARDSTSWFHESVPRRLRQMHEDGFRVVFFTNQGGVAKGHVSPDQVRHRLTTVADALAAEGVPVTIYVALGYDFCRKPRPGMWQLLESLHNDGVSIDRGESLFVGDAAGRRKENKLPADFSADDWKFALNLELPFHVPEAFFAGSTLPRDTDPAMRSLRAPKTGNFRPDEDIPLPWSGLFRRVTGSGDSTPLERGGSSSLVQDFVRTKPSSAEIVLLVGPPAAGKSSLSARIVRQARTDERPPYERINQDTLKTKSACVKAARDALSGGASVIIDSQNKDGSTRDTWLRLAEDMDVPVRAINVRVTKGLVMHLNTMRSSQPGHVACSMMAESSRDVGTGSGVRSVPTMVIHSFFKNGSFPLLAGTPKAVPEANRAPGQSGLSQFFSRTKPEASARAPCHAEDRHPIPDVGVAEAVLPKSTRVTEVWDVGFSPGPFQEPWQEPLLRSFLQ